MFLVRDPNTIEGELTSVDQKAKYFCEILTGILAKNIWFTKIDAMAITTGYTHII